MMLDLNFRQPWKIAVGILLAFAAGGLFLWWRL